VKHKDYLWETLGQPEDKARLWLLWQVLWLDSSANHFSVRVLDEQGQPQGQQDAVGYPTEYRQRGIASSADLT
jgi:hypothetical protein